MNTSMKTLPQVWSQQIMQLATDMYLRNQDQTALPHSLLCPGGGMPRSAGAPHCLVARAHRRLHRSATSPFLASTNSRRPGLLALLPIVVGIHCPVRCVLERGRGLRDKSAPARAWKTGQHRIWIGSHAKGCIDITPRGKGKGLYLSKVGTVQRYSIYFGR